MRSLTYRSLFVLFTVALVGFVSFGTFADGVIIPDHPEYGWLTIVYHRVHVEIRDGVVTTHVDQLFRNDTHRDSEGRYVFPLPPGALVSSFSMWVDGEALEGRILTATEAREIYEDYVRRAIDPALLEYIGRDTLAARIYPIPAGGERRIEIVYTELLQADQGVYRYRYPLDTERFSAQPLEHVKITVDLETKSPLRAVYSPTHGLTVNRVDEHSATAVHEDNYILPSIDFLLYYSVYPEQMGMTLLTYRAGDDDGYFLLILTPQVKSDTNAVISKDLALILDQSGSMSGEKIEQAKQALIFILGNLNPEDRFAVIAFSDIAEAFNETLMPVTAESIGSAINWVERIEAGGGTNIDQALTLGFSMFEESERARFLVFLTDGEATVGEMDTLRIVEHATAANDTSARLFTFGVGYNVNTVLLDRLAQENRGTTAYVQKGENLEVILSSFYSKIASPVLSDPQIDIPAIEAYDSYPRVLPDVFRGSQLLLVGRYHNSGGTAIELTGDVEGESLAYTYQRSFPEVSLDASFLPRLWAGRKIASLLDQIRFYGESDELIDEVIRLSKLYGIITPYTSFLVDESKGYSAEEMADALGAAAAPAVGAQAVKGSASLRTLAGGETVQPVWESVRVVDDRTYFMQDGVWADSTYTDQETIDIVAYSGAHFDLASVVPWIAPHLALGDEVIIRVGEVYVRICETGLEQLTEDVIGLLNK
ncbi:TPA: hypothetical protein DIT45_01540 [Candidatus Acetothermia bacterium]|nr:hypothetical protein [Candidatus Acetothermia bacterium]